MEITEVQYQRIAPILPVQRGNVSLSNLQVLNAILYVAEQGCKWRGLPPRFGNWHTVYTRMNRWSKNGVLDRVFEYLQREHIVRIKIEAVSMDSTIVKVHPDGTGALKKTDPSPSASPVAAGPPRFIWLPRMLGSVDIYIILGICQQLNYLQNNGHGYWSSFIVSQTRMSDRSPTVSGSSRPSSG